MTGQIVLFGKNYINYPADEFDLINTESENESDIKTRKLAKKGTLWDPYLAVVNSPELRSQIIRFFHCNDNQFSNPVPTGFQKLRGISKAWEAFVKQDIHNWKKEHARLFEQSLIPRNLGYTSVERVFQSIIDGKLLVANFTGVKDSENLTDDLIDRLFEKNPHILHLMLPPGTAITQLSCTGLQTLLCSCNPRLIRLPQMMPELTHLDCSKCTSLISLPEMPKAISLRCSNCEVELPVIPNLSSLNYCKQIPLEELYKKFPKLGLFNNKPCSQSRLKSDRATKASE